MPEGVYSDSMPALLHEYLEKGLTIRLCAVKLGIAHSTLAGWLCDADKNGETSKYWDLFRAKEAAKAARAERLMGMYEKASANRAPHHFIPMLAMCDEEYKKLEPPTQQNNNAQNVNNNATTLTDADRLTAISKLLKCSGTESA